MAVRDTQPPPVYCLLSVSTTHPHLTHAPQDPGFFFSADKHLLISRAFLAVGTCGVPLPHVGCFPTGGKWEENMVGFMGGMMHCREASITKGKGILGHRHLACLHAIVNLLAKIPGDCSIQFGCVAFQRHRECCPLGREPPRLSPGALTFQRSQQVAALVSAAAMAGLGACAPVGGEG